MLQPRGGPSSLALLASSMATEVGAASFMLGLPAFYA